MKEKIKNFIAKNKTIVITCSIILILVLVLVLNSSFAAGDRTTRTLYRNQYFTSDSTVSDPVLSKSPTGTTNFVHEDGPDGASFIGFALSDTGEVKYATVANAAEGTEDVLYSMYEQTTNTVEFVNLDEDTGKPISGSEFQLTNQEFSATSTSDKSGRVKFFDVPNGTYKLINTATSGGYQKVKKEIEVEVGR